MARHLPRLLLLIAMLAGCAADQARAAGLAVEDGVVVYSAEAGEVNEVAIYPACMPQCAAEVPDTVTVYVGDMTAITPGPGCAPAVDVAFPPFVGTAYACTGVTAGAHVDLGDLDDYAEVLTPGRTPVTVLAGDGSDFVGGYDSDDLIDGGAGNDRLYGGHGDDRLLGGAGNDEIDGDYGGFADGEEVGEDLEGAGADTLDGGDGDDRLQGNGGADVLIGGAGTDTASYRAREEAVAVSFNGQADDGQSGEQDQVSADVEAVATGRGNDTVHGSDGAETINTGAGSDTVDPRGGEDIVETGDGSDTVNARDGAFDKIGCGDGADVATVDGADVAGSDCEQQVREAGAAPPPQPSAVRPVGLALRVVGRLRRASRRLRLAGELQLPAGSDRRQCAGSAVTVTIKARRTTRMTTTVGADCRFTVGVPVRLRRGRAVASARFHGTSAIEPATSRRLRVRPRR